MIAATALLMMAEAATACAPLGGFARLGGGALLVRPVGTFEPLPFERLGPTESVVTRPTEIQQAAAEAEADEQGDETATEQCEVVAISIA